MKNRLISREGHFINLLKRISRSDICRAENWLTHDNKGEDVEGNEIDDEHVAAPGRNHVEVGQRAQRGPHHRARLQRFHPQEIRELKILG